MEISSERNDLGNVAGGVRSGRAGLRSRPAATEPTGLFVVVEMTVLVIVAALAMVAVIVSSNDLAGREPVAPASRHVDPSAARHVGGTQAAGEALRGAGPGRPADGIASR